MNPNLKKVILGGAILILVVVLGYLLYKQFNGGINVTTTTTNTGSTLKSTITNESVNPTALITTSTETAITDEIVEQLKKVSTIKLSTTLITSNSFSNLIDLSTTLPEDTSTGRRNPFMVK